MPSHSKGKVLIAKNFAGLGLAPDRLSGKSGPSLACRGTPVSRLPLGVFVGTGDGNVLRDSELLRPGPDKNNSVSSQNQGPEGRYICICIYVWAVLQEHCPEFFLWESLTRRHEQNRRLLYVYLICAGEGAPWHLGILTLDEGCVGGVSSYRGVFGADR